jgi:hypothetical protein
MARHYMKNSNRYLLNAYRELILSYLEFEEHAKVYGPSRYHDYLRSWYRQVANMFEADRHVQIRMFSTEGYIENELSNTIRNVSKNDSRDRDFESDF